MPQERKEAMKVGDELYLLEVSSDASPYGIVRLLIRGGSVVGVACGDEGVAQELAMREAFGDPDMRYRIPASKLSKIMGRLT